jgi:hypothetical protein
VNVPNSSIIGCVIVCAVLALLGWGAVEVMRALTYPMKADVIAHDKAKPQEMDLGLFVRAAEQHRNYSPQAFLAFRQRNEGQRIHTEACVTRAAIGDGEDGKLELHLVLGESMDVHGTDLVSACFPGWPESLPPRNDDLPNGVFPCDRIVIEGTIGMVNSIGAIFTDCKVIEIKKWGD